MLATDDALWSAVVAELREIAEEAARPVEVPGWTPQPKQALAWEYACQAKEMLYGGAAGGGKSFFTGAYMVWFALSFPGAHIGLVRATLGSILETHHKDTFPIFCEGLATYNGQERVWRFKNGSVIRYLYLDNEKDAQKRKGAQYDLLVFEEVTEIDEANYTYLLTRLRSARGHRTHAICTANPEGSGYVWVKRRFVKPRHEDLSADRYDKASDTWAMPQPMEVWNPPLPGNREKSGPSRVFVPATVRDNLKLLETNPDYLLQLESDPDPRRRAALLDGDWDAMDQIVGALWSLSEIQRVSVAPQLARCVVAVDPAISFTGRGDESGIIAAGVSRDAKGYVLADKSSRTFKTAEDCARAAIHLWEELGADSIVYEFNQGGKWVEDVLRLTALQMLREGLISIMPPIESVVASRGKATRAKPVASLYRAKQVWHAGTFGDLEEQMSTWVEGNPSPDRMDALVWALTHLAKLDVKPAPQRGGRMARVRR